MNVHRSIVGVCAIATLFGAVACGEKENDKPKKDETANAAPQPTQAPAPTAAPTPAPTAAATAAATATADADAAPPAPPPDQTEVEGKPPSPKHTWVKGYWYWDLGPHKYEWHKGYWDEEAAIATSAPPAIRVERIYRSPGTNYFWMPGYWRWNEKAWAWAPGHYGARREGYAYTHPTYIEDHGKWARHGFGWEKEDATFKKKYTGWDKHGDVYVPHAETAEFVKRGEKEGWYKK